MTTEPSYNFSAWEKISQEGISFVKYLLTRDPKGRPNAKKALSHVWIKKADEFKKEGIDIDSNLLNNL